MEASEGATPMKGAATVKSAPPHGPNAKPIITRLQLELPAPRFIRKHTGRMTLMVTSRNPGLQKIPNDGGSVGFSLRGLGMAEERC